jgi:hypothetical protein
MDHETIEQRNIAELYATGRLPPEDVELFEEHLLECRECRERVAWADDLRETVQTAAVEDAVSTHVGLLAWLSRRGLAIAALLALILLPAWLLLDRSRLERELAAARRQAESRPAPPVPDTPSLPTPAPPADNGEPARLAQELKTEREAHARLSDEIARLTRPQVNTAIFSLGVVRGEQDANEVELGREPEWIVLSVDPPQAGHDLYRATLLDSHGRTIWKGDGLRPGAGDALVISVYSTLLAPGDYRLRLTGVTADGKTAPAGDVPFRVR